MLYKDVYIILSFVLITNIILHIMEYYILNLYENDNNRLIYPT